jgi:hypothetical protein
MSKEIKINKTVYDKNAYERLVDTKFSQIGAPPTPQQKLQEQPSVNKFFKLYNDLFYDIPENGEIDSHKYLIEKSSEYINYEANSEEILALQNEIADLRQQLLTEQKRIIELQTSIDINSELNNPNS